MERNDLDLALENLDKERLVSLVLKLKDINSKLSSRVALLESQIDDLTDFDTLLESVKFE